MYFSWQYCQAPKAIRTPKPTLLQGHLINLNLDSKMFACYSSLVKPCARLHESHVWGSNTSQLPVPSEK